MKILLTGAGGQLGQCLMVACRQHEVVALDHRALDITELDQVREAINGHLPDIVVNASAFNDVDGAESRIAEAYAVNALGPRNLAVASGRTEYRFCMFRPITYSTAAASALITNSMYPARSQFTEPANWRAKMLSAR